MFTISLLLGGLLSCISLSGMQQKLSTFHLGKEELKIERTVLLPNGDAAHLIQNPFEKLAIMHVTSTSKALVARLRLRGLAASLSLREISPVGLVALPHKLLAILRGSAKGKHDHALFCVADDSVLKWDIKAIQVGKEIHGISMAKTYDGDLLATLQFDDSSNYKIVFNSQTVDPQYMYSDTYYPFRPIVVESRERLDQLKKRASRL